VEVILQKVKIREKSDGIKYIQIKLMKEKYLQRILKIKNLLIKNCPLKKMI
jgi:hypothetical protein